MPRDLSRHRQARTEKTTTCARIPLRTRHGPSCHCDPPARVHSKYWKSHTTTIFCEVRFLDADPHRFVLLISLFHQMKGMPWMFTPSPSPWAPGSDVTPGRGGHLGILVGVCRPVLQILTLFETKKCHFPHPYASSDQTSKLHTSLLLHTCCQTWSLGRIMSSEIRAQTKNS